MTSFPACTFTLPPTVVASWHQIVIQFYIAFHLHDITVNSWQNDPPSLFYAAQYSPLWAIDRIHSTHAEQIGLLAR